MQAEISVLQGKRIGETFQIQTNQRLLFGRDINCDVQLYDEGVSRRHFTIEGKGNSFLLCDLNSSNGTYINSRKTNTKILRSGDVIRSGDCEFVFHYVDAEHEYAQTPVTIDDTVTRFRTSVSKRFDIDTALGLDSPGVADLHSERMVKSLKTLYEVGNILQAEEDLDTLFNTIMDLTLDTVQADRAYLIMWREEDDSFDTVVVRRQDSSSEEMVLSRSVLYEVIKKGLAILSSDLGTDDRFSAQKSIIMQNIRSVICVPVQSRSKTLGALYLDNLAAETPAFTEHDLELIAAIGKQAGIAIQRAKLFDELETLFYGTVKALVATVEAKDKYTHGHSERVTEFSLAIARDMDLPQETLDTIRLGCALHDIGKIAVPERILHKPSRLTEAEFLLIKNHPVHGAEILRNIAGIEPIIEIVLHHHEKWNGMGYPDGLAGEDIPLTARIAAVADAFDAMTSSRPYRRNFSLEEVIQEFERCAGDHFDPVIVKHFVKLVRDGEIVPHLQRNAQDSGISSSPAHAAT